MPCRYYTEAEERDNAYRELNKLTRLLCAACARLDDLEGFPPESTSELSQWWRAHQAADADRDARVRLSKRNELLERVKQIESLGGKPGAELLDDLASLSDVK